jgi:hypothetical protein
MPFSSSKVEAPQITGSLFGTSSWAVSASWAPSNGGASQGVAYQTAQSGTLLDVSISTGSIFWSTRSIGGDFQPGDMNIFNAMQAASGGGVAPNTFLRYYRNFNTSSNPDVQSAGTGQPTNYSATDKGFGIIVDTSNPTIVTFKPAATSSVETALLNGTPGNPGQYNSSSLLAATGSIYYATNLQRYRILRNKALGWEDLVPSGSGGGSVGNLQSVTTAGNQTSASINITGSLTNGLQVLAIGDYSHAEGRQTTAIGNYSHAQGQQTTARAAYSHAEGEFTTAFAGWSHAEGRYTVSEGNWSHTEGYLTTAKGTYSHAEGFGTVSSGSHQHVQGQWNIISPDQGAFIIGNGIADLNRSNLVFASGSEFQVTGSLEVSGTILLNGSPITSGGGGGSVGTLQSVTTAGNQTSQSIVITGSLLHGDNPTMLGFGLGGHVEGTNTFVAGFYAHSEGSSTTAKGNYSHAEGIASIALGQGSHAEGFGTTAKGSSTYTHGYLSVAHADYSRAEGWSTNAYGEASHVEGFQCVTDTTGRFAHAEGDTTAAWGTGSHSEGFGTRAQGHHSHAEGIGTIAISQGQHAQGQFNRVISGSGTVIIGNGTSDGSRSNLLFASGSQVQITGSLLIQSASVSGEAVSNIGDTFTSTAKATKMVTCTSAEYSAITTKDPNTFYIVI